MIITCQITRQLKNDPCVCVCVGGGGEVKNDPCVCGGGEGWRGGRGPASDLCCEELLQFSLSPTFFPQHFLKFIAFCIAGGISAAVTTPLDVAKTRVMLAEVSSTMTSMATCYYSEGLANDLAIRTSYEGLRKKKKEATHLTV